MSFIKPSSTLTSNTLGTLIGMKLPKRVTLLRTISHMDDSKSYIYSAYNEIQSELESEGFPKHSTFTACKFDDVRSQKTDNSKVTPGKLKTEIYQAISYQKTNQNKSSSKAIPIKAHTPLLAGRRSSQSNNKASYSRDKKPKFTEEK